MKSHYHHRNGHLGRDTITPGNHLTGKPETEYGICSLITISVVLHSFPSLAPNLNHQYSLPSSPELLDSSSSSSASTRFECCINVSGP